MKTTLLKMASGLIACLALVGIPPTASADTIFNKEPNDTFATAQVIPPPAFTLDFSPYIGTGGGGAFKNTSETVPHVTILRPGTDETTANFDYFRFHTSIPGTIVADIVSRPLLTDFDTVLHLFTGSGLWLASNDNKAAVGPGDLPFPAEIGGRLNSKIETGILMPGDYVVAVANAPSFGANGGVITGPNPMIPAHHSYTLNISAQGAIPAPSSLTLLVVGMASLMGYAAWRKRKTA
jgi:hypothetical protein